MTTILTSIDYSITYVVIDEYDRVGSNDQYNSVLIDWPIDDYFNQSINTILIFIYYSIKYVFIDEKAIELHQSINIIVYSSIDLLMNTSIDQLI